jgi:diacylglycerol kinase family enzyme
MQPTQLTKVVTLVNTQAGASVAQAELVERIEAAFARRGISGHVELLAPDELATRAHQLLDDIRSRKVDAMVAGGGDGTIQTVAAVLVGTGMPLGIVPLGTLNHFAKDLAIPLDLDAAVGVIAAARSRAVDVGEVNGSLFINNSSIGIYPFMVLDRERRRRKTGLQKWAAMVAAVFRTLRHIPIRRLRVCSSGQEEPFRTPCLFVGNNEYGLEPVSLGARLRLDEGVLWLCIAKQTTRLSLIWLALRSLFGLVDPGELRTIRVAEADITSRTSRLLVALDGEVQIMRPPLHFRIKPGALLVYAPSTET